MSQHTSAPINKRPYHQRPTTIDMPKYMDVASLNHPSINYQEVIKGNPYSQRYDGYTNKNRNMHQKVGQNDKIRTAFNDNSDRRSNWKSKTQYKNNSPSISSINELSETEKSIVNSLYRLNINSPRNRVEKDGINIKKSETSRNRKCFQPVKNITRKVLNTTKASNTKKSSSLRSLIPGGSGISLPRNDNSICEIFSPKVTNVNSIRCNAITEAKLGHYEKSFKMLHLVLDVQRRELGNNVPEVAETLRDMVYVLKQSGKSHLKLKFLYEALRIISKQNHNFIKDDDLAMIHEKIGDAEGENGNFVTAAHHMCCARDLHHSEERFRKLVYFEKLEDYKHDGKVSTSTRDIHLFLPQQKCNVNRMA
jgi:hypothetical protein